MNPTYNFNMILIYYNYRYESVNRIRMVKIFKIFVNVLLFIFNKLDGFTTVQSFLTKKINTHTVVDYNLLIYTG